MPALKDQFADIESAAVAEFTAWRASGIEDEHGDVEFVQRLTHETIVSTLRWAARDMRRAGPTIAAILLEQRADEMDSTIIRSAA